MSTRCRLRNVVYTDGLAHNEPFRAEVKTRYSQKELPALICPLDDKAAELVFDAPVRALTAGQSAVFYDNDYVVGGGIIT